jgi:hypothetical protein
MLRVRFCEGVIRLKLSLPRLDESSVKGVHLLSLTILLSIKERR